MKKTVKVVMLATTKSNKDGDIVLNDAKILEPNQVRLAQLNVLTVDSDQPCTNQHLYLISDDEIKEGDWYIATDIKSVIQCNKVTTYIHGGSTQSPKDLAKKIIATTDISINDSVEPKNREFVKAYNQLLPQIPESFIQAYIKAYNEGKPITEVDLEYKLDNYNLKGNKRIITPKTRPDNTVIVHQAKMYTRDEVEKLLGKILADSNNPKYTVQDRGDRFTMDQIFPLNKWIQDNL